jgi:hypothetical protein
MGNPQRQKERCEGGDWLGDNRFEIENVARDDEQWMDVCIESRRAGVYYADWLRFKRLLRRDCGCHLQRRVWCFARWESDQSIVALGGFGLWVVGCKLLCILIAVSWQRYSVP